MFCLFCFALLLFGFFFCFCLPFSLLGGSYGIDYDPQRKVIYVAYGDNSKLLRFRLDDSDLQHPVLRDCECVWHGAVRTCRVSGDHVFVFGEKGIYVGRATAHGETLELNQIELLGQEYLESPGNGSKRSADRRPLVDSFILG
jgi:hypothetical protein